jgi:hypothetical protein
MKEGEKEWLVGKVKEMERNAGEGSVGAKGTEVYTKKCRELPFNFERALHY